MYPAIGGFNAKEGIKKKSRVKSSSKVWNRNKKRGEDMLVEFTESNDLKIMNTLFLKKRKKKKEKKEMDVGKSIR